MVVDELPRAEDVVFEQLDSTPARDGLSVFHGTVGRRNSGERVPITIIAPPRTSIVSSVVLVDPALGAKITPDLPVVRRLLADWRAVIAIDPYMAGDFRPPAKSPATQPAPAAKANPNPAYAGYTLGYERSVLANRVHDLLSAIVFARSSYAGSPHLIAFGDGGPSALLARALAGDSVSRAAIDLHQFDFDQIKVDADPMLLPGGLKYGGIYGVVPLCTAGPTLLCNTSDTGRIDLARHVPQVTIRPDGADAAAMAEWLVGQP
jgi:hypothetical protein